MDREGAVTKEGKDEQARNGQFLSSVSYPSGGGIV